MSDDEAQVRLQAKLKELGERFVERSLGEIPLMQGLLAQAQGGDGEAQQQLLQTIHRISGSGAMLGFATVSECARHIERILRTEPLSAQAWEQIGAQLLRLESAIKTARRAPL